MRACRPRSTRPPGRTRRRRRPSTTASPTSTGAATQPFVARSAEQQLADAKAIAGSDFFELVRSTAVVEIYSDPQTWKLLGYEGPSFAQGGYIDRGFNDLDWLPDPEQEA